MPLQALKRILADASRNPQHGSAAAPHAGSGTPAGSPDTPARNPDTPVAFRCNLCGTHNVVAFARLARETPSCSNCGSTVRFRAMAHLLTAVLFGEDIVLSDLPPRKDLTGIGLSDADAYATPLAQKLRYTNTWFHAEPRVDIGNTPPEMSGRYDFLIASDVFEHVAPPVSRAFANARRILKPGGVFVFTVPFALEGDTIEHFPDLHDFRIVEADGHWTLHNRTVDGRDQTFTDLVFHGGPGTTLEMRLFSRPGLERAFAQAGFASLRIAAEPCLAHGIVWPEPWSVPMVARA